MPKEQNPNVIGAYEALSDAEKKVVDSTVRSTQFTGVGIKTTLCLITCNNGYEIIGQSSCIDPKDYDFAIGARYSYQDAVDKLMKINAYNQHPKDNE